MAAPANHLTCLRLESAFGDLRSQPQHFDVNLSCDGGMTRRSAHRVVLAANSAFFRDRLAEEDAVAYPGDPAFLVDLPDVTTTDLDYLLDLVYCGKVNMISKEASSFLAVAKQFGIKILTQKPPRAMIGGRQAKGKKPSAAPKKSSKPLPAKRIKREKNVKKEPSVKMEPSVKQEPSVKTEPSDGPSTSGAADDDNAISAAVKTEACDAMDAGWDGSDGANADGGDRDDKSGLVGQDMEGAGGLEGEDGKNVYDYAARYGAYIKTPSGGGRCLTCGKTFPSLGNAKRHYESSHCEQSECECFICKKSFKNQHVLKDHLRKTHKLFQKDLPKNC